MDQHPIGGQINLAVIFSDYDKWSQSKARVEPVRRYQKNSYFWRYQKKYKHVHKLCSYPRFGIDFSSSVKQ